MYPMKIILKVNALTCKLLMIKNYTNSIDNTSGELKLHVLKTITTVMMMMITQLLYCS